MSSCRCSKCILNIYMLALSTCNSFAGNFSSRHKMASKIFRKSNSYFFPLNLRNLIIFFIKLTSKKGLSAQILTMYSKLCFSIHLIVLSKTFLLLPRKNLTLLILHNLTIFLSLFEFEVATII